MPGFNLIIRNDSPFIEGYDYDALIHEVQHVSADVELNTQSWDGYPFRRFSTEKYDVFLEGYIYNVDFEKAMPEILDLLERDETHNLSDKLKSYDGEFVIIVISKSDNTISIINDSWGRLPVYKYMRGNTLIITRNISFITKQISLETDKMGLSCSLLFGYSLGLDTIWRNVTRMAPNAFIKINPATEGHEEESSFKIPQLNGSKKASDNAEKIGKLFDESHINRMNALPNLALSLSGGMDSRSMAASLKKSKISLPIYTYSKTGNDYERDTVAAKTVIESLEMEDLHEFITLGNYSESGALELLSIKQGFNYLSMSFIIPYLKLHRERNQSILTGEGGGKFMLSEFPLQKINNIRALSNYILKHHGISSLSQVSKLTSIAKSALRDKLESALMDYPYESMAEKYVFFILREERINWEFEGEDRNRYYAWSTSPYYSPEFIAASFEVSMDEKKYGNLFKELLKNYPGKLYEVSNPNWKTAPTDTTGIEKVYNRQRLKGFLPQRVVNIKKLVNKVDFQNEQIKNQQFDEFKTWDQIDKTKVPNKAVNPFYWQLYTLLRVFKSNS